MDVRLSSKKYLSHLGDVLQEVLVEWVSNLQPANECEGCYFFPTIGDFGELILKEIEVRLEVASLPHSDREEVAAVSLSLLVGGICFSYLSEVVK